MGKSQIWTKRRLCFDAYLSRLPTLKRFYQKDINNNEFQYESFGEYIQRVDTMILSESREIPEWEQFVVNQWVSANGIIYNGAVAEETSVSEYIFSDFSKEEAYLLLNIWMNIEKKVELIGDNTACIINESKNSLSLSLGDGLSIFLISFGHSTIIKIGHRG